MGLESRIQELKEGYSEGMYKGRKYGITKNTFNSNRSFKVYAKVMGGNDFISLNYYVTKTKQILRPCEMPDQKVIDFLKNVTFIESEENINKTGINI